MPKKVNSNGIGLIEVLIAIVVIVGLVGASWLIWRHDHRPKANTSSTISTKSSANQNSVTQNAKTQTNDPYAGWKTYCDNVYGYCFRYPTNWHLIGATEPKSTGDVGGFNITSPQQIVQVIYGNAFTNDQGIGDFSDTYVAKLGTTSQQLTLLGGYIPSSGNNGIAGNNVPQYTVIDTSLLNKYPQEPGKTSRFLINAGFTDKVSGYTGSFTSKPTIHISTIEQAKSWLNSEDALTSIKILESIYYKG